MRGAPRGVVAGCALGVTSGWNFGNVGGIASELGRSYGVGLATVGLLTTAMVVTHVAIQIPGGKASDRFGPAGAGIIALVVLCAGNALALAAPEAAVAAAPQHPDFSGIWFPAGRQQDPQRPELTPGAAAAAA